MASISMTISSPTLTKSPFTPKALNLLPQKAFLVNSNNKRVRNLVQVKASFKETVATGLTAAALTASMVVPDVAEAATSSGSLTPSLQNFLYSIGAGGVVLVAILGAVIGVSNFDPVKRA